MSTSLSADIGIALLPTSSERLDELPLVTTTAVAVVARSHLSQALGEDELIQITQFEASSVDVCCHLAAAGMGVGIVNSLTASSFTKNELIALELAPQVPLTYGILIPPRSTRSIIEDRAIELLLGNAEKHKHQI
ncbi:MAG: hypothetical protein KTR35_00555 [Gammaproteobacteria bacterium]|nr:hypothetical protein [Gammaproteobacteria bacterium]